MKRTRSHGIQYIAASLWDLLRLNKPSPASDAPPQARPGPARPIDAVYASLVDRMKQEHSIRVVRWRKSTSGCAWTVTYINGRSSRLIEAPYPRGPISCAVFLHEVGHHAIGIGRYRPRCLEEYHAWKWAIDRMHAEGLNVTDSVRNRMHDALHYAVRKAVRRGIKRLPVELEPYLVPSDARCLA
ncbi:MAG: hypothetical protein CMJ32_09095 [Phycisphaerae bacterium]|nr:hypothetical protein [Phycisphaerae bacterium]